MHAFANKSHAPYFCAQSVARELHNPASFPHIVYPAIPIRATSNHHAPQCANFHFIPPHGHVATRGYTVPTKHVARKSIFQNVRICSNVRLHNMEEQKSWNRRHDGSNLSSLVHPAGFEPTTSGLGTHKSNSLPLNFQYIISTAKFLTVFLTVWLYINIEPHALPWSHYDPG